MKKQEKLHVSVVPFSHLDLFWAGSREECLSRGNNVTRKALDLLEKHKDFRFLLETMNFADNYLSCFPEEKGRIKRLVEEGRLELGPAWSGIYLNLPSGETLIRNIQLARSYAKEKFGASPSIAHFGDLPGYTPQYPQIAKGSGLKGVLMSRGGPASTPLFQWKALDGSKIPAYFAKRGYAAYVQLAEEDYAKMLKSPHFESSGIEETFDKDAKGKGYPLLVHWGCDLYAPTERLIRNVRRWNKEGRRKLVFSTLGEYFAASEEVPDLPVLAGEVPSAWPNIESSWPDIWPEDLPCETSMHMAEFLSSLCLLKGWNDYPSELLAQAWKSLLDGMDHNQNAQGGDAADRDKLKLKLWARDTADRISTQMSWRLASRIKAPHAQAFPLVAFNSMSWRRDGVVTGRAAVYGEVQPSSYPGHELDLKLIDSEGKTVPYVLLKRYKGVSSSLEIAFPAKGLPACGYQAYYLAPGKNPCAEKKTCEIALDSDIDAAKPQRNQGSNLYENSFFRLEIDAVTGEASLFDKRMRKKLLDKASIIGVEERRGNYIWDMTPSGRSFPSILKSIETLDNNAVWCRILVRGEVYGMPFAQTYTLYREFPEILLENEIDWKDPRWVRLEQTFRPSEKSAAIRYAVPFGQVSFPEEMGEITKGCFDELDLELRKSLRLCRQWVDFGTEDSGLTIGCDHRMWEFKDGQLASYMIRGTGFCLAVTLDENGKPSNIARPPAGKYRFRYLLRPRCGSLAETSSWRCGWELNNPTRQTAVCDPNVDGEAKPSFSLLDFSDASVAATAVKKAENGEGIVVRAFESAGLSAEAPVPEIFSGAPLETNMLEEGGTKLRGKKLKFKPFEVKTLLFKKG